MLQTHFFALLCRTPPSSYLPPIPPIYVPPIPPPSSLLFPTSNSICICNPLPFILPPTLSLSLQRDGITALTVASANGRAEAIKLLLTAPGIDVNHADVSLYLLIPSHLVLGGGGEGEGDFPHLIPNPPSQ